jgi:biopolymer transport protein ExbB
VPEKTWRHWINYPDERKGPIGELLDFVTGVTSLKDTASCFEELRTTEIAPFERDIRVMKICVGAAPLLGLLGTVTGMLATFGALASGSGGEKTMGMVAAGISEALITTETGLVVALPGLFFLYYLSRKYERYKSFLAHLETVCTQDVYRKLRERSVSRSQAVSSPGMVLSKTLCEIS